MSHEDMLHRIAQQAEGMRRHGFEGVAQTLNDEATALRAEVEAHEKTDKALSVANANLLASGRDLEKARGELATAYAVIVEKCGERQRLESELSEARGRIEAAIAELRADDFASELVVRAFNALSPPPPQPETKEPT